MTQSAKVINTQNGVFTPQHGAQTFEDADAEKKLLGRILSQSLIKRGNDEYALVERLAVTDFSERKHQLIWHGMRQIVEDDQQISLTTLENRLKAGVMAGGALAIDQVGADYIKSLMSYKDADTAACMQRIAELAVIRHGKRVIADMDRALCAPNKKIEERSETMLSLMTDYSLRVQALSGQKNNDLGSLMVGYQEIVKERRIANSTGETEVFGVTSCLQGLQKIIKGYKKRKLYVVAGRPGQGKTSLALNEAVSALLQGLHVVFVTLEMDEIELIDSIVSIMTEISGDAIESGNLSEQQLERLDEFYARVAEMQAANHFTFISFDVSKGAPTMAQIKTRLREHMAFNRADIVFLDQISVEMIAPETPKTTEAQMLTNAIATCKHMARTFNLPFVVMAQLNRATDHNPNARPTLGNLANSDSLVRTADVVMAMHRPPEADTSAPVYPVDVLVLKQRKGSLGDVRTVFTAAMTKFSD